MNEKKIEDTIVSKDSKHDDVEKEIEDLKAEIDNIIKGFNEVLPEEKKIMEKIIQVLDEHELKYTNDDKDPKHIELGFSMENKPFRIHVILQRGKIIIKLGFPFRVQANAIAIMGIYISEFNSGSGTAFSPLTVDFDDGELYMDYSYMLEDPNRFDEKSFWVYMTSHINFALQIYTKVARISVGLLPRKDKKLYKELLKMALETIDGNFDDDKIIYGTESLKTDSISSYSRFLEAMRDDVKDDDTDANEDRIRADFIRSLMSRRRRPPSIEKFISDKERADESGEEEIVNDTPNNASEMLSMFAKRNEEKNTTVVEGENDE